MSQAFDLERVLGERLPDRVTAAGEAFLQEFILSDRVYLLQAQSMVRQRVSLQVLVDAIDPESKNGTLQSLGTRADETALVFNRVSRFRDVYDRRNVVDNFLTYLCELMGEILRSQPAALKTKAKIELEQVLVHASMEDFIAAEVEHRMQRASRGGWSAIRKMFEKDLGLPLATQDKVSGALNRAIMLRNLLTHRRGLADDEFIRTWISSGGDSVGLVSGERVPRQVFLANLDQRLLLSTVLSVDCEASAKFSLVTQDPRDTLPGYELNPDEWLSDGLDAGGHDPLCPHSACACGSPD